MHKYLTYQRVHFFLAALLLPLVIVLALDSSSVSAITNLQHRYDELSDPGAGATSNHNIGFIFSNTATPVGSILIQFCAFGPLPDTPCDYSDMNMDISNVTLSAQSGNTGFSMATDSSDNTVKTAGQTDLANGEVLLTNPSVPLPAGSPTTNTYTLSNIVNPSSTGEYYVRVQTFSATDGSGSAIEFGGIAIQINSNISVNSIVPPFLTFCGGVTVAFLNCGSAQGSEIDFGDLSSNSSSDATSQFMVATNAQNGYTVSLNGSTMTSGNNVIPNLTYPSGSKIGNGQFGLNVVTNTVPRVGSNPIGAGSGVPTTNYGASNLFTFNEGDNIVTAPAATDYNEFTTSYLVNVSSSQPEGVYSTTINYICLANF